MRQACRRCHYAPPHTRLMPDGYAPHCSRLIVERSYIIRSSCFDSRSFLHLRQRRCRLPLHLRWCRCSHAMVWCRACAQVDAASYFVKDGGDRGMPPAWCHFLLHYHYYFDADYFSSMLWLSPPDECDVVDAWAPAYFSLFLFLFHFHHYRFHFDIYWFSLYRHSPFFLHFFFHFILIRLLMPMIDAACRHFWWRWCWCRLYFSDYFSLFFVIFLPFHFIDADLRDAGIADAAMPRLLSFFRHYYWCFHADAHYFIFIDNHHADVYRRCCWWYSCLYFPRRHDERKSADDAAIRRARRYAMSAHALRSEAAP